jgi:hypothetical protein
MEKKLLKYISNGGRKDIGGGGEFKYIIFDT